MGWLYAGTYAEAVHGLAVIFYPVMKGLSALVLLFMVSTSSASPVIYAFDQNPAGEDYGNEWVTLYNPSNESVDIGGLGFRNYPWFCCNRNNPRRNYA